MRGVRLGERMAHHSKAAAILPPRTECPWLVSDGWGVQGLGISRQKPDAWPLGRLPSFVNVRRGQELGQK